MFIDTVEHRVRLVRPRSFAGLMTLYESNHVRLRQLFGNLWRLPESAMSASPRDLDLYMQVEERSRYTTTLHMTYWFEDGEGRTADPDLMLRIYHDARLVETMSCADAPRHEALRGVWHPAASEMEQRWTRNILLHKWLEFCLDNRHAFLPAEMTKL
ncbi:MAG: DUF1249 domain-containing protein [Gammaproteobacteria bacterium]